MNEEGGVNNPDNFEDVICTCPLFPQAGESDWVYVLESVDAFNKLLVGAGLDDLADKDDTRLRTLIHGQRNGYWRQYPK